MDETERTVAAAEQRGNSEQNNLLGAKNVLLQEDDDKDDDDDDDDDDIELVTSNCSHEERSSSCRGVAAAAVVLDGSTCTRPCAPTETNTNHSPFCYGPHRQAAAVNMNKTTAVATGGQNNQEHANEHEHDDYDDDTPSPLPVTFVEFVTLPPDAKHYNHLTSPRRSLDQHHYHQETDDVSMTSPHHQGFYPLNATTTTATTPNNNWLQQSPSSRAGPFRLLPRSKTTLDKLAQQSSSVAASSSACCGNSIMTTSPMRPRKRSAWSMEAAVTTTSTTTTPTSTSLLASGTTTTVDSVDVPASPGTALKQHLHRLSIHSPAGSSGEERTAYDGYFHGSSTPLSFAKTTATTPPTLEDSPCSGFSRVVVSTNTSTTAASSHLKRQSNSMGNAPFTTTTMIPSPRIVPLTVLTHDSNNGDSKLPPLLRPPGRTATKTTYQSRVFPPRSPPEVRGVWSLNYHHDNDDHQQQQQQQDCSFLPHSPHSGASSWSNATPGSSRRSLPKISLTPRSLAKRSPVIPRFPFKDDDDFDTVQYHHYHRPDAAAAPAAVAPRRKDEPITVASFPRRTRTASDASPRVGESIFGPPTPHEVNNSFQQLQQQQQDSIDRPDMESLSDNDEDDEFLLAFPSTLAEEKLQQQQRCRNIKARKCEEFLLGDKRSSMTSMTSMASSSYASLRGIAYAPSDPDLQAHGMYTTDHPASNYSTSDHHLQPHLQDGHIGWVFDADDHIPARDLKTPPIPTTTTGCTNSQQGLSLVSALAAASACGKPPPSGSDATTATTNSSHHSSDYRHHLQAPEHCPR